MPVLHGIDLDIASGEFVAFVGPSGCGKTTLLRCIAGLEEISGGTFQIDGKVMNRVAPAERGIAMVFQSHALYPHMTVFQNMAFGWQVAGLPKAEIAARVAKAAEKLQLTPCLGRYPKALSGGQRQGVAVGRAITRNAGVFLFDEPLSNLDAALRASTRVEIAALKKSLPGTTMIYVTDDQVEAMTLADRIVVLRTGQVEQVGRPIDIYRHPANLFGAGFIGSPAMNIFPVGFDGRDAILTGGARCDRPRFARHPWPSGCAPRGSDPLCLRRGGPVWPGALVRTSGRGAALAHDRPCRFHRQSSGSSGGGRGAGRRFRHRAQGRPSL